MSDTGQAIRNQLRMAQERARVAEAEADRLKEALEAIQAIQPGTLAVIRQHGFVFDDIGAEPGNWQHLAFTIYTDLCETESVARAALAAPGNTA